MCDRSTGHPSRRSKRHRRSTDATRAQRNREIVADRIAGLTWAAVAEKHGLSQTQVRQIVKDHEEAAGEDAMTPLRLVVEPNAVLIRVVRDHERAMDLLMDLAEHADNDSARVGAAKGAAAVGQQLLGVLKYGGLMPEHGWQWLAREQWEAVASRLVRAANEDGLPADALRRHIEEVAKMQMEPAELRVGVA